MRSYSQDFKDIVVTKYQEGITELELSKLILSD